MLKCKWIDNQQSVKVDNDDSPNYQFSGSVGKQITDKNSYDHKAH